MNWLRKRLQNWLVGDINKKIEDLNERINVIVREAGEEIQDTMMHVRAEIEEFRKREVGGGVISIKRMREIEREGLDNIKGEMGSMYYISLKKQVAVKIVLSLLIRKLGFALVLVKNPKGELYPVLKRFKKPVEAKIKIS